MKPSPTENISSSSSPDDGDRINTPMKNEEQLVALANLKQVSTKQFEFTSFY